MGYSYRNNGQIKDFWPDDDEDTMYISGSETIQHILNKCYEKWGRSIDFDTITMESQYIHTECLTYDLYCPGDYTEFIVIRRLK